MTPRGVLLVVGADGFIGRALADHLRRSGESVVETTRRRDTISEGRVFLDLRDDVAEPCLPCRVAVAFLCVAVSSLEACRRAPVQSAMVNVHKTVALAQRLAAGGAFVVFLSTNLVYDGSVPFRKAEDPVCPETEYGRQKAEAERQLAALGERISVIRLTKVLGPNSPLFKRWMDALQHHHTINPFSNMVMAPVSLPFAIHVLHQAAKVRLSGIVQVSGDRDITYEQAARHLAQRLGASPDLVQPIKAEAAGLPLETIPLHTTLDTTRLRVALSIEPPDIWSAVDAVLGL